MILLAEFLLRLAFGLAGAMAIVSPRQVTSGYFRNHLYVTLGLAVLAALLCRAAAPSAFWPAALAAALSYVGSVCWLYEKPLAGKIALLLVAGAGCAAALLASGAALLAAGSPQSAGVQASPALHQAQVISSGAVLGVVMAAMLLGHWYLNAPGMQLAPLRRLLVAAALVVVLQCVVSATGLGLELTRGGLATPTWLFLALRWSFGLVGVLILIGMAWRTLEIPNTQSATGILYVAVIGTFVGETMALLLSAESAYPL